MQRIHRHPRTFALIVASMLLAAACGGDPAPPPGQMAADVARLDEVVAIVQELQVTDFEQSAWCTNLAYERGTFGMLEQDGCARDGTGPFDAVALADHARLAQAIEASGVEADRIRLATYDGDGDLETAWFALHDANIQDNWEYLLDPNGVELKQDVPGQVDFTQIDGDWWFVRSFDD